MQTLSNETFIHSDGISPWRQLERQRDGEWIQTHRDLHQEAWLLHCSDPRQVRLNVQSHFFSGMATCGPTGAQQSSLLLPKKKNHWNLPPKKTSSPSPATALTAEETPPPYKQRAQQAGVGDLMETTHPLVTSAFDLRLMHRAMV